MKLKRLWWTICTSLTMGGNKRARYAREHGVYAHVGRNVSIQSRAIPVYSELIYFHDNVRVARNVDFVTHDVIHAVLNCLPKEQKLGHHFNEHIGCIEVMDNVMIGSNSVILYGTRIGPNVIIASGSVVTKDCEPDSVYAGVPARKIGSFDEFVQKRMRQETNGEISTTANNQALTKEEIDQAWRLFRGTHDKG